MAPAQTGSHLLTRDNITLRLIQHYATLRFPGVYTDLILQPKAKTQAE